MKQEFAPLNSNLQASGDRFAIQQLLSDWAHAKELILLNTEVSIDGDTAVAHCQSPSANEIRIALKRLGGSWHFVNEGAFKLT